MIIHYYSEGVSIISYDTVMLLVMKGALPSFEQIKIKVVLTGCGEILVPSTNQGQEKY